MKDMRLFLEQRIAKKNARIAELEVEAIKQKILKDHYMTDNKRLRAAIEESDCTCFWDQDKCSITDKRMPSHCWKRKALAEEE